MGRMSENQLLAAAIVVLIVLAVWLLGQRSPDRAVYEPKLTPATAAPPVVYEP